MIDIYQTWVRDSGVDGFRIDTVKHVNMEFWQQFSPALTGYAASSGNDDFFMFGEVFDADPRFMSPLHHRGQAAGDARLRLPEQPARTSPTAIRRTQLRDFFAGDDYYTDADSNAYSLPTFLGNHDMGRIGSFVRQATPARPTPSCSQRDQLAHSLMFLTRGQPVVYYGDEQGFTGSTGGDKDARQDMFAVPGRRLQRRRPHRHRRAPHADGQLRPEHPLYQHIAALSAAARRTPGAGRRRPDPPLRRGRGRHLRVQPDRRRGPGRVPRGREQRRARRRPSTVPTFSDRTWCSRASGRRARNAIRTDKEGRVTVTVPPLSAVVLEGRGAAQADRATPAPFFTDARGRCAGRWPGRDRRLGARRAASTR